MHILLIGPQGSGKGTQADLLAPRFGLVKLSTGDLFRAAIAAETPLGLLVKKTLADGKLVDDETTLDMVAERLDQIERDGSNGVVYDGFPRTLDQAMGLDSLLAARGTGIDLVIELMVPEEVLVQRLSDRWVCSNCGTTYHLHFHPTRIAGSCDRCGGTLIQREDDKPDAIRARLHAYEALTKPLLEFYGKRGIVRQVNGDQDVKSVEQAIVEAVVTAPLQQKA